MADVYAKKVETSKVLRNPSSHVLSQDRSCSGSIPEAEFTALAGTTRCRDARCGSHVAVVFCEDLGRENWMFAVELVCFFFFLKANLDLLRPTFEFF